MLIPRLALALLVATLLLTSCGGADESEIARTKTFMAQLCKHQANDHGAFDKIGLVKASKPYTPVPAGTIVAVTKDGITVNSVSVTTAAQLAAETRISNQLYDMLREERRTELMIAARDPSRQPKPLVLAFDASIPARSVQVVLYSLFQAEHRRVLLAFEPGIAPQFPPAPDRVLDDELRRIPEDQLPLYGANKMAEQTADCPALADAFSLLASVPPEARCDVLTTALGEAFASSSCSTDIDKVLTLVHAMTVPRKPATVHQVVLHPDAPGIPTKPTDTWAQVAEALFKRGDDRLWLEPPSAPAEATPAPQ